MGKNKEQGVLLNLPPEVLKIAQELASREKRSRKSYLEFTIINALKQIKK